MTHQQSALSELAEALIGTDATLASRISEIMATALQELIEAELSAKIGAEPGEADPVSARAAQRLSAQVAVYPGRRCRGRDSQAATGIVLPRAARGAPSSSAERNDRPDRCSPPERSSPSLPDKRSRTPSPHLAEPATADD